MTLDSCFRLFVLALIRTSIFSNLRRVTQPNGPHTQLSILVRATILRILRPEMPCYQLHVLRKQMGRLHANILEFGSRRTTWVCNNHSGNFGGVMRRGTTLALLGVLRALQPPKPCAPKASQKLWAPQLHPAARRSRNAELSRPVDDLTRDIASYDKLCSVEHGYEVWPSCLPTCAGTSSHNNPPRPLAPPGHPPLPLSSFLPSFL